jgi:hypothetical protein
VVDASTDPELTFTLPAIERHTNDTPRRTNVEDKKDGHRAYTAERKAKIIRLTADLRNSDSLLTEFVGKPDQTATKYGLQLTEEEVSTLAAIAGTQELTGEALEAVAGGADKPLFFDNNCGCGKSTN